MFAAKRLSKHILLVEDIWDSIAEVQSIAFASSNRRSWISGDWTPVVEIQLQDRRGRMFWAEFGAGSEPRANSEV